MRENVIEWIKSFYWIQKNGQEVFDQTKYTNESIYWALGMFAALIAASIATWMFAKFFMVRVMNFLAVRSSTTWDDHLVSHKVFRSLAHLVPLGFMEYFLSICFYQYPKIQWFWSKMVYILIIWSIIVTINRALSAFQSIIVENEKYRDKPIQSYIQVMKIVATGIFLILLLSILTDRTPVFFLTSLGAISAILVLVFKDTILGFIGSIQIATNDIIRIGDWVTMEKYGADGNVEIITLSTVKIRNFDKTITTIPTYAFVSDSFKNWRGMEESDGRRIKRPIFVQIDSVNFASDELVEKLMEISFFKEFVERKQEEIKQFNIENNLIGKNAINARRMTNIGLFRAYIEYYLKNHPRVNKEMPLLVRQLESKDSGVPLEIYCFSLSKVWDDYESLQADIFDHVFAVIHFFELRIFESPSGHDFKSLIQN